MFQMVLTLVDQLILKDFAMNDNEEQLKTAAHLLMRSVMTGLISMTVRKYVDNAISTSAIQVPYH